MDTSPLTGLQVNTSGFSAARPFVTIYADPVCGEYALCDHPGEPPNGLSPSELVQIAKVLATQKVRGRYVPTIITSSESGPSNAWTKRPVQDILNQYPKSVKTELDEALINISKSINSPSDIFSVDTISRWLLFAHDEQSEKYNIEVLQEQGYIKRYSTTRSDSNKYQICAAGWDRLDELESTGSDSTQAFVAMWFSDDMREIFDNGIYPAIDGCGFNPKRIDQVEHNNKICDEIIFEIRRSRFLVADFTGNRGGVYFEAGFAHGLGIPVIWTVKESDIGDVHFDTRQYNHITYSDSADLKDKLSNRIKATIA